MPWRVPIVWLRIQAIVAVLFIAFSQLFASPGFAEPPGRSMRVVGYLPDYRLDQFDAGVLEGVTDVIIFSAEPREDGSLDLGRLKHCPWEKLKDLRAQKGVRLMLAIGGWGRSGHFARIATAEDVRRKFAEATVRLAVALQLDGIDLDWEHPRGIIEEEAYGRLLIDLSEKCRQESLWVSVTIAGWQRLPPPAIEAVNAVHVMAYDHPGEHATIDGARKDVAALISAGVPAAKLILGVPFYGRHVETREATAYRDLVATFAPASDIDRVGAIFFNGPHTIVRKVEYASKSGLGGVMVWELGQDAAGERSLLAVIRSVISRKVDQGQSQRSRAACVK
jgi:chitinase